MRHAVLLTVFAVGCASDPPTVTAPLASTTSTASTAPTPTVAASPPQACPLVALDLVLTTPKGPPQTVLSLTPSGELRVSMMGPPKELARLDPRGCLVSADGVEVDVTRGSVLWTPHQRLAFSGSTLRLEAGRSLRIEPSGDVVSLARDGSVEPNSYGGFSFNGYSETAACAARVLLVTFLSMMPSMAVSDGHPKMLPPPEDSACAELHRAK